MYLALYRKWRPKTFDDVVSQEHITTTLKHEIVSGMTAHSYLFTGPGNGKNHLRENSCHGGKLPAYCRRKPLHGM